MESAKDVGKNVEVNEYQDALNDVINNAKDWNVKNDSFWLLQELVDKHEKIKKALNKAISESINKTGKVLEREEISYIQALQFTLKLLEMSSDCGQAIDWSKDER